MTLEKKWFWVCSKKLPTLTDFREMVLPTSSSSHSTKQVFWHFSRATNNSRRSFSLRKNQLMLQWFFTAPCSACKLNVKFRNGFELYNSKKRNFYQQWTEENYHGSKPNMHWFISLCLKFCHAAILCLNLRCMYWRHNKVKLQGTRSMLGRRPVAFANFPAFYPRLPLTKRPSSSESFMPQLQSASGSREEQFHPLDCWWASSPWTEFCSRLYPTDSIRLSNEVVTRIKIKLKPFT